MGSLKHFYCVLKSGGDFGPADVQILQSMVMRNMEDHAYQFTCLTDMPVPSVKCIPLQHGWPGWWSKMELFGPSINHDILFMDLDTVLLGPMHRLFVAMKHRQLIVNEDFYRPAKMGSGLMIIPHDCVAKKKVWHYFSGDPQRCMKQFRGDMELMRRILLEHNYYRLTSRVVPGDVKSYKVDCLDMRDDNAPPLGTQVVCFHGKPRPIEVNDKWVKLAREGTVVP